MRKISAALSPEGSEISPVPQQKHTQPLRQSRVHVQARTLTLRFDPRMNEANARGK